MQYICDHILQTEDIIGIKAQLGITLSKLWGATLTGEFSGVLFGQSEVNISEYI